MVTKVAAYGAAFLAGVVVAYAILVSGVGGSETSEGNDSVRCWNFATQSEAQAFWVAVKREDDPADYAWLDVDADGIVCEELP